MAAETIVARVFDQARRRPDAPAHFTHEGGAWRRTTWAEHAALVRSAARALVALGVRPGETTAILGFNRAEWVIFDVATMAVGAAPAGIYTTCSPEEVAYIVDHAEAPVVLVEDGAQWRKIEREARTLTRLRHVVFMKGASVPAHSTPFELHTWEGFLARGEATPASRVDELVHALEPGGLATLIYTSGTTGPPKGVMLSHANLAWTASQAVEIVGGGATDAMLSYLPLSHIAEQVFTIHGPATMGSAVYFARSIEKVPEDLKDVQPTIFFGVPRVWEKFHAGIAGKLAEAKGAKKHIAAWAMKVGARVSEERCRGRAPRGLLALEYALASRLVFSKLKPAVGLGRAHMCVSGAAPIAAEVLRFFASLDIVVHEVYGQSEDTGPTSFNQRGRTRFGTVGPVFPGVEVKIAPDEEILVRGPNVFLGYFKEPEATAEALEGGWLHTGDLGAFDADGFLAITGRKKEIIITAGGKNVAPKNIEAAIKNHPLVAEAVVIGDRRKYLVALVALDPEATKKWLADRKRETNRPHEVAEIQAEIQRTVDAVNATLARVEQIKRFRLLHRAFTMEHGELTPTLKIKRKVVAQNFAAEIDAMYEGE
jgi:long-chain acyl-CoA synthetase